MYSVVLFHFLHKAIIDRGSTSAKSLEYEIQWKKEAIESLLLDIYLKIPKNMISTMVKFSYSFPIPFRPIDSLGYMSLSIDWLTLTVCNILDLANYTTAKCIVKLRNMPQRQKENQKKSNYNTLNTI